MRIVFKLALSILCVTFGSLNGSAQQIYTDNIKDAHDRNADQNQQVYSQALSLTQKLPLDLMAVNEPEQFKGLAVTNTEGVEIGRVVAIARKNSNQALHVVIEADDGPAAIRINKLTLGALAYWDPAGSLHDQHFDETEFEPVSQYQTGHTAWGSLTPPTVQPAQTTLDEQPDNTHATTGQLDDAADNSSNTAPVYEPVGSSVVQLALNHPDGFQQKLLVGGQSETLGHVSYIARNLQDQELYAVVTRIDGGSQTAVKLDALTIAGLVAESPAHGVETQTFNEDEFETIGTP